MSTSSLYGSTDNVVVSSNNVTTLYNATHGNIVSANVPDRNFTTLYTNQSEIAPTRNYGNANVEAFLNTGTDGSNVVQNINAAGNIHANGNLTISGITNLGPASNVHITGGNLNYVLQTDGAGNLSWTSLTGEGANSAPYIHFDVPSTSNNQTFTNANLSVYANSNVMAVFKNGINIEPNLYTISGNILTVNILLNTGDTIDVLPSAAGAGGSNPGGNLTEIQYNGGITLSGNSSFTFDQPNSKMTVGQISTGNIVATGNVSAQNLNISGATVLSNIANLYIPGGGAGQFLSTNGNGVLSWSSTVITSINANIANVHISGGTNGQVLSTDGSNNLSWTSYIANANYANSANIANIAESANTANSAITATSATTAGSATTAETVTINAQPNITSVGTLTGFSSTGTVSFTGASNVALGSNSIVHIDGGTTGQVLSTDGAGNLSWLTIAAGVPNYANFAGTVVNSSQPNITSVGTLTDVTVSGNIVMQRAFEKFTTNATGATGTINYDTITQSILYHSGNATANCTINLRGNSTVTFNTLVPTNDTITVVFLNTVGATAYINSTLQIDGTPQTVRWSGNSSPTTGTRIANCKQSYTYTVMKTGVSTYTVLGSLTEYV